MTIAEIAVEHKIAQFIQKHNLVPNGATLLAAVSGGPDSVCLLHSLVNLRKSLGIKLHVAHLNHKLRGDESDEDTWYVISLCERLGIPSTIDTRDVMTYSKQKHMSLEEAARELRYGYFSAVAKITKASCVAVGHTSDDQVETIIMHILRGTGIDGLQGLQPESLMHCGDKQPPLTIIRPLLTTSRQETLDYCRIFKLKPRIDSSNKSVVFFRNRIRLKLLPALRKYNPGIDAALLRLSSIAFDQTSYIEQQAAALWVMIAKTYKNITYLDKHTLVNQHVAMQRQIFRLAIQKLVGDTKDFEAIHIEKMITFLTKKAGKSLCLPHNLRLSVEYDRLVLAFTGTSSSPFPHIESEIELNVPGETLIPGWKVIIQIVKNTNYNRLKQTSGFVANFDPDITGKTLSVRGRKRGDRFQPLGMSHYKKLQDFMVDARIPRSSRNHVPLVCSPEQILWVVGYRIDDRAKVQKASRKVLSITFNRITHDCGL